MKKQQQLIAQMTGEELYRQLFFTQVLLFVIGIIAAVFTFDHVKEFLILLKINPMIIITGVSAGIGIVLADLFLMKHLPQHYYDDGGINEKIFSSLSPGKIAKLAACIAVCEELLFRGVIQANFGILCASIIFAVIHIRYFNHWYLAVNIIILSFIIGAVFAWTQSLWATIILHFIVDFLLGLVIMKQSLHKNRKEGESHETRPI
ncbi:type II CAAX endopeptidase family protein [Jeotgalibacillus soli]|uniref:CAAX prenyl protease 2/Lysostaphin resistance protein A-like domain-containing protein n=1 Tax=Jeotgalibacillus soli TaxID=889306 RepID=A0A0C2R1P3_9BACL|nr:type II CAAX endopeptidase family protein [Jeotgalibacillus soli]KIL44230.1 hypothetical protein KP78_31940 [Jeotgalibacillus soli]